MHVKSRIDYRLLSLSIDVMCSWPISLAAPCCLVARSSKSTQWSHEAAEAVVPTTLVGATTRVWKTNVGNDRRILRSLCKTENQRVTVYLLNATPHAEVGVNVDFQLGHAPSLTEWWHRSRSCMQTTAIDAVDGHRRAEEEEGLQRSSILLMHHA